MVNKDGPNDIISSYSSIKTAEVGFSGSPVEIEWFAG